MEKNERVIAYFDGFNYYEALRAKKWKKYYWQDFVLFTSLFLKKHQSLTKVKYFSARQHNVDKSRNQDKLFQVNKLNQNFDLILGDFKLRHKWKTIQCNSCNKKDGYQIDYWEEKKSDVALASYMIKDVLLDKCDVVFLFSADSDLTPAIEIVKDVMPRIKIITLFPPGRISNDLKLKSNHHILLERHEERFKKSLFPDEVILADGFILKKPEKWN